MIPDAVQELALLVFDALARLGRADIPVPEMGHGTDDQIGDSLAVPEHQHLVLRVSGRAAGDVDLEGLQQVLRGVEEGGGIMVSGDHHHMAATEGSRPAEEAVIQLLRPVARRSGVENVARHHQDVDPVVPDRLGQPLQKGFVFLVPFSAVEGAAEMPVRRVEDSHFRRVRAPSRARKDMSPGQRGSAGVRKRLSGEGFILFMGTPPVRCLHCRPIPPGRQFPVARHNCGPQGAGRRRASLAVTSPLQAHLFPISASITKSHL
ncbi:hypothetical protein SDC9_69193 [bioreactor metagenome]|uniref:Uncharacterized protein n=1 Tax=bioreactor metagenome TaxID=1076179 RepID=A0A644Y2G6_9ZZZZ